MFASDALRCSGHAGRAGALISSRPRGARAPGPWWASGLDDFHLPLHSCMPNGILLLYPFSPGSSGNLPSGASCSKGDRTATCGTGPGMRPMPGRVWCRLRCSQCQHRRPCAGGLLGFGAPTPTTRRRVRLMPPVRQCDCPTRYPLAQFIAVCSSSILAETLGCTVSFSSGGSRSLWINCNQLQMLIN